MPKEAIEYDVAVIGGGPAGMMAAGRAAELGARVILFEKNSTLGKKLLITGGGRSNITNAEFDAHKLLAKFKNGKQFLFSPFSKHGVAETLHFFNSRKMPTKVELENRVFPKSNSAQSVWNVLVAYMRQGQVTVAANSPVIGFELREGRITGVKLKNKKVIYARSYVLATGGKSRPETGSTGDGFAWLKALGHSVIEPDAALVPIKIKDLWVRRLAGVSLRDVKLTTIQNNEIQSSSTGKMLFTHFGVSGPLVLNMSQDISELLKYGEVTLLLDLVPRLDVGTLDKSVQSALHETQNKKIKNAVALFLPPSLAPAVLELSGIDAEKPVNIVSREERLSIVRLMKNLPMTVSGLMGVEKAIVTSGGASLKEIDFKTMQSLKYPDLFIIGDVLNVDRPSGGYSLQLCWTTGFVAGTSAAGRSKENLGK